MGQLRVEYFKISTFGGRAPLTVKIIQDEVRAKENSVTVYISFKTDFPDSEINDGVYEMGKINIYPS